MSNSLVNIQEQELRQEQRLSAKQVLCAHLTELSLQELRQRIDQELKENTALERAEPAPGDVPSEAEAPTTTSQSANEDSVLSDPEDGTEMHSRRYNLEYNDVIALATPSFRESLISQMRELEISDTDAQVLQYLIDSLDDDGLLRRSASDISDELAFKEGLYVDEADVNRVTKMLQTLEPAGIGACTLQECLLIQVDRRERRDATSRLLHKAITQCWDEILHNKWDRIADKLDITREANDELRREFRRLNPKPGMGSNENLDVKNTVVPDFIVETDDEGNVTFSQNRSGAERLRISPDEQLMLETLRPEPGSRTTSSRRDREARQFLERNIYRAQTFIEVLRMRENTLTTVMRTIIKLQMPWFREGYEELLRPMKLEDIGERTGLDLSTISRACKGKYVQSRWGIHELRWFFGDESRQVKLLLRQLISAEDPRSPLSDEQLMLQLRKHDINIARRTVAKYREALHIPTSSQRKQ